MRRSREYKGLRFTSEAILDIFRFFERFLLTDYHKRYEVKELTTEMCGIIWEYFSDEALFKAYIPWVTNLTYKRTFLDYEFMLFTQEKSTFIGVKAHTLMQIQPIFDQVEKKIPKGTIQWEEFLPSIQPFLILGHGKGSGWKSIVDYLYMRHGYALRCFEIGGSSFRGPDKAIDGIDPEHVIAVLVVEKEDLEEDCACEEQEIIRNNLDYLEKTLGESRMLYIVEKGVEIPALLGNKTVIEFRQGHIKETFLQVAGKIRREFG